MNDTKGDVARQTILIGQEDVEALLDMNEALAAVEKSFILKAQGKAVMPCKIYLELPEYGGDFRAMPAFIDDSAGIKWVGVYPENHNYGLPAVMAVITLCHPATGYPVAIMDGTHITGMRTGAAGGIAVKYLARKEASIIGMVGTGRQAETQLMAIRQVLPSITQVKAFSPDEESSRRFVRKMGERLNLDIRPVASVAEAAAADVIVTTTYATGPVVLKEHVRPGTHINAIGADAPGKQELGSSLLSEARIVVDDLEQAGHSGEINLPLARGEISIENIRGTLGDIVSGTIAGRENDEEITIFDSTGLAIQDLVCAKLVYEKASRTGATAFRFF